eukprot:5686025-Pyramimonas_sp.AAC.1
MRITGCYSFSRSDCPSRSNKLAEDLVGECCLQVLDRVMATFNGARWWASSAIRVRAQSIWKQRSNDEMVVSGRGT